MFPKQGGNKQLLLDHNGDSYFQSVSSSKVRIMAVVHHSDALFPMLWWLGGLVTYLSSLVTKSMLGISLSLGDWRLEVAECRLDLGGLNFDTSTL